MPRYVNPCHTSSYVARISWRPRASHDHLCPPSPFGPGLPGRMTHSISLPAPASSVQRAANQRASTCTPSPQQMALNSHDSTTSRHPRKLFSLINVSFLLSYANIYSFMSPSLFPWPFYRHVAPGGLREGESAALSAERGSTAARPLARPRPSVARWLWQRNIDFPAATEGKRHRTHLFTYNHKTNQQHGNCHTAQSLLCSICETHLFVYWLA